MAEAKLRALEAIGLKAETYAKKLCPADTGGLRQSIGHTVDAEAGEAYIGTNSEYAAYVELGTGKYYPGGRPTPWVYQDAKGQWHRTQGQEPQPYLKPAVSEHGATFQNIMKTEMKNA